MITTNVINQYDTSEDYQKIIEKMVAYAVKHLKLEGDQLINYILVDNPTIQTYNASYRKKDQATDVLSFDNMDSEEEIGDIFISIDKAIEQAKTYKHSFERELAFLSLHGLLHCLGYDHIEKEDEKIMFALQDEIIENTEFRRKDHYEK